MHTSEVAAAEALAYLPEKQAVQLAAPTASELYVPAVHDVHTADELALAAVLYRPLTHAVHTVEELAAATLPYAPLTHPAQADALGSGL